MKICSKCKEERELTDFGKLKASKDGLQYSCKTCVLEYNNIYRINNRGNISINSKKYADNNKEKRHDYYCNNKEKIRENYYNNKEEKLAYNKKYRLENIDSIKEYEKQYRINNADSIKEKRYNNKEESRIYRVNNKDRASAYNKKYRADNRESINEVRRIQVKDRKKSDPLFKLTCNLRILLYSSFKNKSYKKNSKSQEMLGCSFKDIITHLNDNPYGFKHIYGEYDVDHIVPLATATTEEELLKLNHYTNLQLLPSVYNRYIKRDNPWDKDHFENWLSENWSW